MTKRHPDWYKLQKNFYGWQNINPDLMVIEKLKPLNLRINFDHCHYALRDELAEFECSSQEQPDFYIITDIELSKKPLSSLFKLYQSCYEKSRVGIYLAALSYYLEPDAVDPTLIGSYSENIDLTFRKHLSFVKHIEQCSTVVDYPLVNSVQSGKLIEGANYIFVHPNIKYFLWK